MKKNTSIILLISIYFVSTYSLKAQFPSFPPSDVTNYGDRAQMLEQLGLIIPELPLKMDDLNKPVAYNPKPSSTSDPEGNWTDDLSHTITRSGWGLWNSYSDKSTGFFPGPDSARLGVYPPIELLKMKDSTYVISSAAEWWNIRRPEILKDVQEQVWGVIPHDSILPEVTWSVVTSTGGSGASAYIQKVITGTIDISRYPAIRNVPKISATLRVPAFAADSVPVMIAIAGTIDTYWNYCYPQGWGACAYDATKLQPDNGAGLTSYLIGLCNKGNWRTPEQWGALAAWGWGISKLIDYFETDPLVDATKIGVTGHSRYGKATIVAMAYDQRLFIGFPSDGGSLGTKMNRRHWGQDFENSTWDQEYHWMAGNFFKWVGEKYPGQYLPRKIIDCPVDAHSLLALCAPRPMLLNGGNQSSWCDPFGQFLTTIAATPVYELLGNQGMIMNDGKPILDKGYIEGDIAYRYHNGGHTDQPEWPTFWQFASKYVKMPTLSFTPSSIILSDTANSTAKIIITSDTTWNLTKSTPWLTLDKSSGSYNDTITLTVDANLNITARKDTIKFTAPGMKIMYLLVNQKTNAPGVISLAIDTLNVAEIDNSEEVSVLSNSVWTITNLGTWITADPPANSSNGTVRLNFASNTLASIRTQMLVFYVSDTVSDTLVVNQAPGPATLAIWSSSFTQNPTTVSTAATANNSAFVYAITNSTLTAISSETWMNTSISPSFFTGWYTVNLTVQTNPTTSARHATLTISVPTLAPINLTVTQAAAAVVSIVDDSISLSADENSAVEFDVISNTNWTIASPENWLMLNPSSGSAGTTAVTLTASANPNNVVRIAKVIALAGTKTDTLTVSQNALLSAFEDTNLKSPVNIYYYDGKLTVIFNEIKKECRISVLDFSGKQLKLWDLKKSINFTLPVSDLPAGMYIIAIMTDKDLIKQKFVK